MNNGILTDVYKTEEYQQVEKRVYAIMSVLLLLVALPVLLLWVVGTLMKATAEHLNSLFKEMVRRISLRVLKSRNEP